MICPVYRLFRHGRYILSEMEAQIQTELELKSNHLRRTRQEKNYCLSTIFYFAYLFFTFNGNSSHNNFFNILLFFIIQIQTGPSWPNPGCAPDYVSIESKNSETRNVGEKEIRPLFHAAHLTYIILITSVRIRCDLFPLPLSVIECRHPRNDWPFLSMHFTSLIYAFFIV